MTAPYHTEKRRDSFQSMADPNLRQPYGKIVWPGGSYQLTPADVLWAARSASFEGGSAADVLWTMTQRFVLYQHAFGSFAQFVQSFSQPVNPDWRRTGKFCRAGGTYADTPACSPEVLDRRDVISTRTWGQLQALNPQLVDTVLRWANGQLPNPVPRVTNFAAPTVASSWLTRNDGDVFKTEGNTYIVQAASRPWSDDHVVVEGATGSVAGASGVTTGARPSFARVFWRTFKSPIQV